MRFVIIAALLASVAIAAPSADLIPSLPGWGQTKTPQYSGYLNAQGGKHLHYWLVTSENNSATDPIVLWFNGGPGCSSLEGYLYEQGPYHIIEPLVYNGTVPKLYENPYRWNQVATMVFIEAPAGVGFSYSDTQAGYNNNDTQQAIDNYNALVDLLGNKFPEYQSNPLFVSGESYAGMYVPTLALQIIAHNSDRKNAAINFKGILVGNGVTGYNSQPTNVSIKQYTDFYIGHGLFANNVYSELLTVCNDFQNITFTCQQELDKMHNQIDAVNIYDIYQPCINGGLKNKQGGQPQHRYSRRPMYSWEKKLGLGAYGPVECIDSIAGTAYLNVDIVRQALHVAPESVTGKWHVCGGQLNYDVTWPTLLPYYPKIIDQVRVLIYNGDVDACIPFTDNEGWTTSLGLPVAEAWRAWFVNNQVAGYVTKYSDNFQFITVKGSGHMVPQFRPQPALEMFKRFINGQPF